MKNGGNSFSFVSPLFVKTVWPHAAAPPVLFFFQGPSISKNAVGVALREMGAWWGDL